MSIIRECQYCLPEVNEKRTYRKQTEVYDAIGIDVPMCWNCGEVALFERERIIKLLEENLEGVMRFSNANVRTPTSPEVVMSSFTGDIIALIKGENK